jgi:hypothetical protein
LVLLACGLFLALGLMWRTSSGQCHEWKDRLRRVTGAYLAAAGEQEYPQPGTQAVAQEREALRRATNRMLDDRPFACI